MLGYGSVVRKYMASTFPKTRRDKRTEECRGMAENWLAGDGELGAVLRSHNWSQTPLGAVETWSDDLKTAVQILLSELELAMPSENRWLGSDRLQDDAILAALHQANQLNAFRVKLTDALRPLTDASEIQAIASRILAESLGANRVIYIEVALDGEEVIVHSNYTHGVSELSGRYRLEDYRRNLSADHQTGCTQVIFDIPNSSNYTDEQKMKYRDIDVAAYIDVPLVKNNQFIALLAVHQSTPRQWTATEVKMVEETAERTWAAVERAYAEAALRQSEANYYTLFESIDEGFCVIEMLFDDYEQPVDYRFLEINPAFEKQTGLVNVQGRRVRELVPEHDAHWFEIYGSIALTGEPQRFENRAAALNRWYDVYAFRIGHPDERKVAVLFNDISDRKRVENERQQAEAALRKSEEQLRLFITASSDIVYKMNADWSEMRRLEGKDFLVSTEKPIGTWLEQYIPAEDHPQLRTAIQAAIQTKSNFELEHRVIQLDGTIGWTFSRAVPLLDAQHKIVEWLGAASDITQRKQAELHADFLATVTQELIEVNQIDDILQTVGTQLSRYLKTSRCAFIEINENTNEAIIQQDWYQEDLPSLAGVYRLPDFVSDQFFQMARTGTAIVVEDVATDARIADRQRFAALNIGSFINVPLMRDGEWKFTLGAYHQAPYHWRSDEIELMRELVNRIWPVLERVRAEAERKRAEELSQQAAEWDAFRVCLADALRPLADSVDIQATASRVLGEYLNANRVAYFEVRGANYVVEQDYVNGADALTGGYSIDSFGPKLLTAYRRGQTVSVPDVTADPNLSPEQCSAYQAIQIGAYIGIPLIKNGQFVAGLAIHSTQPRVWTRDEVLLAEEVAERTWAAVERARAEAALRESEELKQRILESSKDCIKVLTLDSEIVYINTGGLRLLEVENPTVLLNARWLDFWQGDDYENAKTAIAAAKAGNIGQFQGFLPTHKGTPKWWDCIITPVRNSAGQITQLVVVSRDITKQKQAETERERLLAQEQAAREQAETANRIKDEFLAVLSHELRSPLNPILGWTQLLQRSKLDAALQAKALETIERNAKLQTQLIEDLLDISRIMQGKLSLTVAPVRLPFVISAAVETVQLAAEAKNIQLTLQLDPETPLVSGDAARLQQVIWNVLSNAIKFTPSGGQVTIELRQIDQLAEIRVIDTGKGIDAQFLPYVFEYFRQEDGSTTRQFGGLGLGLAIARQIVEMHGGTVQAASQGEGRGSTFVVQLPTLQQTGAVVSEPNLFKNSARLLLKGSHILLVDDEADTRELQAFLLEQSGAKVTAVASALEALRSLEQAIPDVLVSDIGMAEMDGYMLLQHIRSRPADQGGMIPAVALTAYATELDQQRALQLGFQTHLTKPVEPETLVSAIASLLNPPS